MLVSFDNKDVQAAIKEYAQRLDKQRVDEMYNGMKGLYLIDRNRDGYRDDPDENYNEIALELFIYTSEIESLNLMMKRLSVPTINLNPFYQVLKCLSEFSINNITNDLKLDFLKTYINIRIESVKISHITRIGNSMDMNVFMFICGIMTCYSFPNGFISEFDCICNKVFNEREISSEEFIKEVEELKKKYNDELNLVPDLTENF